MGSSEIVVVMPRGDYFVSPLFIRILVADTLRIMDNGLAEWRCMLQADYWW